MKKERGNSFFFRFAKVFQYIKCEQAFAHSK